MNVSGWNPRIDPGATSFIDAGSTEFVEVNLKGKASKGQSFVVTIYSDNVRNSVTNLLLCCE